MLLFSYKLSESELDSEDSEDDTYDLDDNARSQRLSLILARIIDLHPALDRWHVFAIRMMVCLFYYFFIITFS